MSWRPVLFFTAALFTLQGSSWGQKAQDWRVYKLADGLAESACLSVTISSQGKVLARHLNLQSVSELDGFSVTNKQLPEFGKGRVYESTGGQLWTVVPEGLRELKEGNWFLHPVPEIAAEPHISTLIDPVPLCPIKQGLVVFMLADRLLEFNSAGPAPAHTDVLRTVQETQLGRFTGMATAKDGGLWVSGTLGLARIPGPLRNLRAETKWQQFSLPGSLGIENLQSPHEIPRIDALDRSLPLVVCLAEISTNHQKVMATFDGQEWTVDALAPGKPRQVWRGPDSTRWEMTINALYQWEEGAQAEGFENEEVSARQYYDLAVEASGNFWLATSDGLFRYSPMLWRTPSALRKLSSPIRCITGDQRGRLWFCSGSRIYVVEKGELASFLLPSVGTRSGQARSIYCLRNGLVLLEAEDPDSNAGTQLFSLAPGESALKPVSFAAAGDRFQPLGLLADGNLCVSRLSGSTGTAACPLAKYDGQSVEPLQDVPPAPYVGTNLHRLFLAQNGDLWISGDIGTACFHDKTWLTFTSTDKSAPEAPVGFVQAAEGKIWCADEEQVWEFDGRSWQVVRRGFDRINAIVRSTRDGSIWVACNNGLHRYYQGFWIENSVEEGLPSSTVRELYEDQRGLWAATTHGLSLFHPQADRDPPTVAVPKLTGLGNAPAEGNVITLYFAGQDKWRYTPASRLLYSYRRDDDLDWSTYEGVDHVTYTDLSPGKHTFKVRAMDRNGNRSKEVAELEFTIVLPWYRETRLVLISIAGLVVALFFAALAFNRHRQLVQSYAEVEKKVAERTLQLEMASHELLQSQKMKALGTLAAGIAHDFNNILSIVKGSAQIIEDNLDNPEKIKSRADRIKTVVDQGAGIVRAMLGFSRDSGEEPASCDVDAVADDTLKLLGDRFLREVQVEYKPTHGLPAVRASKDFIQQILLNFIFNAAESMTTAKEILVRSHLMEKLPPELVLMPEPAPAYVAISVEDSGSGIAPEILPRVFEPFFTTKARSSQRGTGLGLSMVYELAKKMGAGLVVESVLEQGSTFTLILPVDGSKLGLAGTGQLV